MKRPFVIGIVVLGAALVTAGVRAQPPPSPGGGPAAAPTGSGPAPAGPMPQAHTHGPPGPDSGAAGVPTAPGQDAFGAIAEVVKLLDADPQTDWSRVDLERLRQHLIDMNEVVLHAAVTASRVPGGLAMDVSGTGRTGQAVRAMVVPHAAELARMPGLAAKTELIPGGVRLTVTAREPGDSRAVARVRGLGFIGLLTLGAHHRPHHLAIARGDAMAGHGH